MLKISDLSVWQIYHVSKWVCEEKNRHHTIHLIKLFGIMWYIILLKAQLRPFYLFSLSPWLFRPPFYYSMFMWKSTVELPVTELRLSCHKGWT